MLFSEFAAKLELLANTSGRKAKVAQLANLILGQDRDDIAISIYLSQWPRRPFGSKSKYRASHNTNQQMDFLDTIDVPKSPRTSALIDIDALAVKDVYELLAHDITNAFSAWAHNYQRSPGLIVGNTLNLKWLAKILQGAVVPDDVLLDALFLLNPAFETPLARIQIKSVFTNVLPDLGAIAEALILEELVGLAKLSPRPGLPFLPEKLQVWPKVESATTNWGPGPYLVQPKYRGEQLVIHFVDDRVFLFDRKKENVTTQFADIYDECLLWRPARNCIIDSEVVGINSKTGEYLGESLVRTAHDHVAYVFDLVILNDQNLYDQPYEDRRSVLSTLTSRISNSKRVKIAHEDIAKNQKELAQLFQFWVEEMDYEGIVIKRREGRYRPGKQSKDKAKVKLLLDVDFVLIGYTMKKDWRVSFLVALWDKDHRILRPVRSLETVVGGKAKTLEILELIVGHTAKQKMDIVEPGVGSQYWMRPDIVVEGQVNRYKIPTQKYPIGYTFEGGATLVRLRNDKNADQADDESILLEQPLAPKKEIV